MLKLLGHHQQHHLQSSFLSPKRNSVPSKHLTPATLPYSPFYLWSLRSWWSRHLIRVESYSVCLVASAFFPLAQCFQGSPLLLWGRGEVNFLEIHVMLAGLCPRSCRATRGRESQVSGKVTHVILTPEGWGSLAPGFTCLHFCSSHVWMWEFDYKED